MKITKIVSLTVRTFLQNIINIFNYRSTKATVYEKIKCDENYSIRKWIHIMLTFARDNDSVFCVNDVTIRFYGALFSFNYYLKLILKFPALPALLDFFILSNFYSSRIILKDVIFLK